MTTIHVPIMECSVCNEPAVLRLSYRIFRKEGEPATEMMYQRDCKHKSGMLQPRQRDDELPASHVSSMMFENAGVDCVTAPLIVPTDCVPTDHE